MVYSKIIKLLVLSLVFIGCQITDQESLYKEKQFIKGQDTLGYRIMYPRNFDKTKQYPLILFLHGMGERGNDNKLQLIHGSKLFASKENREKFPAIVIFPQCPKNDYWANEIVDRSTRPLIKTFPLDLESPKSLSLVMQLLNEITTKPYVNKNKLYVGGMSMGGKGTFEIVYKNPNLFAAAFIICGAGNPEATKAYAKTTPLWVFHGAKDDVVNPQSSVSMVSGILKYGGKPNFNLYAKDGHNSWDSAFAEPQLLPWLFSNKKD